MTFVFAAVNTTAIVVFAVVLSITLGITYWASKRASSAVGFYAAGRGITGFQNGLAISGDYLSAASFLGIAGLIYLFGFDGFVYSIGFLVAFLTVMFLLAERMRNSGKYTIADVLAFRLRERPARVAAAIGTLNVAAFYLIAQMVGAGVLIQALVGIDFTPAVLITGTFMLVYVVFGGMVATTWVQIIKAVPADGRHRGDVGLRAQPRSAGTRSSCSTRPRRPARPRARRSRSARARSSRTTPTWSRWASRSCSAPAGLPHILMRFFTVPNAKAARSSVVYAMFIIGFFYLLTTVIGFGARAILGQEGVEAAGNGGNLAAPNLAQELGGGAGTTGGDLFLAIIAGVAFATILAVVAGLVLSASSAVAHDIWSSIIRKGKDSEREEVLVAKIAALAIGARRDPDRDPRRRGAERLVHGRPRVRDRRERELPGAAARAELAALQHDRRGHRRAVRRRHRARPDHHQPDRVGRPARRARHRRVHAGTTSTTRGSSRSRWASSAATWARCCRRSAGTSGPTTSCASGRRPASARSGRWSSTRSRTDAT